MGAACLEKSSKLCFAVSLDNCVALREDANGMPVLRNGPLGCPYYDVTCLIFIEVNLCLVCRLRMQIVRIHRLLV